MPDADLIVLDEFHLTLLVPRGLNESQAQAASRTLNGRRFQAQLRAAVRRVLRQHPSLRSIRLTLSR